MRSFNVPNNTQAGVSAALQQVKLALKELDSPLLTKRSSLQGIQDGTSAYMFEDRMLCRYTKMKGKLYKECFDAQGGAPPTYPWSGELGPKTDPPPGMPDPKPFTFTFRDTDLMDAILEGQGNVVQIVDWTQGSPVIPDFNRSRIELMFYQGADATQPLLPTDDEWFIGIDDHDSDPQPLSDIVRLGEFVDNGDNTGTIEVLFNAFELDVMSQKEIYFEVSTQQ